MKTHACGALALGGLLRALAAFALAPQRGVWHERFRADFAASLAVPVEHVRLYGAGRSALHALVAALELGDDDEALLPGYTCVVVPQVFLHQGIGVRYVDIAADGPNPSPEAVAAAIGPRTRIVVLPHNFGFAMQGIDELRARFPEVVFVEDAAHAWGSRDAQGRALGTLAQAGFFSFEYAKGLTTGLGGALVLNDAALRRQVVQAGLPVRRPSVPAQAARVATLLYHLTLARAPAPLRRLLDGVLRAPARALGLVAATPAGELRGERAPAYGEAMSDLAAAIGAVQLQDASRVHGQRQAQAAAYAELLAASPRCRVFTPAAHERLLRYPVCLADPADRAESAADWRALGLEPGYWFDAVVHPHGSRGHGYRAGECPHGEALAACMLNLPLGRRATLSVRQRDGLRAWAQTR